MRRMMAPAMMQAMPSSRLLMLTVISFPPGLRRMRLRQFCPREFWPGFGAGVMELEVCWVFFPGLMVLRHLRASTGGFRRALPRGWDPLERDCLRLNPLEKSLRVDLRPFPPQGCFGAADVMRASAGDAGGFLRHSRGGRGSVSSLAVLSGGLWTARSLFSMGPRDRGGRGHPGWSCCPEPGSESRRSRG